MRLWHFLWKPADRIFHLKSTFMKTIKHRLQLLIGAITLCFFIACNNKTETSNSSTDSNMNVATPQSNDSTALAPPVNTETSQMPASGSKTSPATGKTTTTHKRTRKVTA